MSDNEKKFNLFGYYRALEATVISKQINWKQVSAATGVSASTLTRMGQGKAPDSEGLAKLAQWSGLNPGEFVEGETPRTVQPLAMVTSFLANDPKLSAESVAALDAVIKSTYQRLVKK